VSIVEQSTMREADWMSLVYAVERGNCTLMLGPDAVTGTLDGERLPVHVALARFVKGKLGPSFDHLDAHKPSSVAQAAVASEDPFTLLGWVEEFYEQFDADDEMLTDLASLPFELIVNTSPGFSAQRAFLAVKPGTVSDFYDRTARARPTLADPSIDAPVIYHLYGALEQPSSMILSDSDRLDFIVAVVSDQPPLPPKLKSALRDPERTFLFLGFDLAQWQFRVLLHVLSEDAQRRYKSFAIESIAESLDGETQDFYRHGHKIHFVGGDMPAFARELRSRVTLPEPDAADAEEAERELPPDAPVVFLCHASEDKEAAKRVSDALQANGIDTWLDRNELRGGDQWDQLIRRLISDDVDYVVVMQSASLLAKDVGYVNREINLALDRQMNYRPPRRFLIPVVLDAPENCLEHLQHLQATDLSDPAGIDELVRAIKRDLKAKVRQG
jgi:hypothetical protein